MMFSARCCRTGRRADALLLLSILSINTTTCFGKFKQIKSRPRSASYSSSDLLTELPDSAPPLFHCLNSACIRYGNTGFFRLRNPPPEGLAWLHTVRATCL